MKKILVFVCCIFLVNCKVPKVNPITALTPQEVANQILLPETKNILYTLAADSMAGRDTESGGYYKAADFVTQFLNKNGIQPFYPSYRDSLVTAGLLSFNIVGQLGEFNPEKKTVLIGAHLDHVGLRGKEGDTLYNGANDNATGSTAVLQIGKFLAQYDWEQNILIALFADEEKGLKGAQHLANRFQNEGLDITYMVNFEMIGKTLTSGPNQVYLTGYKRSNMANQMNAISPNFVQFLPQAKEFNLFQRSDNYSFYKTLQIPAQTLSSFDFQNYDFYHKAEDEAEKMDVENMNQIIQTAAYTLAKMIDQKITIKLYPEDASVK